MYGASEVYYVCFYFLLRVILYNELIICPSFAILVGCSFQPASHFLPLLTDIMYLVHSCYLVFIFAIFSYTDVLLVMMSQIMFDSFYFCNVTSEIIFYDLFCYLLNKISWFLF